MFSKRNFITLGLLLVLLFALVSGVNAALDHFADSPAQNSFVIYDEQGRALYAYTGDLNDSEISIRPVPAPVGIHFLHRT